MPGQYSSFVVVTKNGEKVDSHRFHFNRTSKVFTALISNIEVDFGTQGDITFIVKDNTKVTAGDNCVVKSGNNCSFNLNYNGTYIVGGGCDYTIGSGSVIITRTRHETGVVRDTPDEPFIIDPENPNDWILHEKKHEIVLDGKIISISEDAYQDLKKQLEVIS